MLFFFVDLMLKTKGESATPANSDVTEVLRHLVEADAKWKYLEGTATELKELFTKKGGLTAVWSIAGRTDLYHVEIMLDKHRDPADLVQALPRGQYATRHDHLATRRSVRWRRGLPASGEPKASPIR